MLWGVYWSPPILGNYHEKILTWTTAKQPRLVTLVALILKNLHGHNILQKPEFPRVRVLVVPLKYIEYVGYMGI